MSSRSAKQTKLGISIGLKRELIRVETEEDLLHEPARIACKEAEDSVQGDARTPTQCTDCERYGRWPKDVSGNEVEYGGPGSCAQGS